MPFSKDELGGKLKKMVVKVLKILDLHKIFLQWKCKNLFKKSIDGKNENTYIHCNLGKLQSWSDGCRHALEIHHGSLRYLILKRSSM
ncbi:hypothetical protein COF64_14470 [Bacillus sp. AFS043905]|nr:hypothetical protein COF64_14470 [Bacillus sp. AFS043905]TWE04648.1 hypothetical protein FB545_1748 [Peribacillus frigoritolerans]